jgi:hypothetical protein
MASWVASEGKADERTTGVLFGRADEDPDAGRFRLQA